MSTHDVEQRLLGEISIYEEQLIFWRKRHDEAVDALAILRTGLNGTVNDSHEPQPVPPVKFGRTKRQKRKGEYKVYLPVFDGLVMKGSKGVTAPVLADYLGENPGSVSSRLSMLKELGLATMVRPKSRKGPATYIIVPEERRPAITPAMIVHRKFDDGLDLDIPPP